MLRRSKHRPDAHTTNRVLYADTNVVGNNGVRCTATIYVCTRQCERETVSCNWDSKARPHRMD